LAPHLLHYHAAGAATPGKYNGCTYGIAAGIMWIVRLALRRPYTFIVAAIAIMILGVLSILRTPKDIFPNINIPVVSVLWNYNGLSPEQMANRIAVVNERALTLTVNDIEHIESQ